MEALPPDEVLVARLRDGDDGAFSLLLDAWSGAMLRVAGSFVSTEASAAEVVQETWLAVIEGVGRFEGRSSLKTWVYRILTNTAKRRGSREHRVVPWSSVDATDSGPTVDPARFRGSDDPYPGHWWEFPAAWPTPEQGLLGAELRARLEAALTALPDRQRVVITLRDVEGYGSEEVCELLGISAANQRVLLHRARAFVRGSLEEYYSREGESNHE
ncbi:MAG TPA: sigma-70 family RNA polymerase sigma factor [Kribbella sp.]|nr:sigma-70 family RNA polymerase sigma factor [Kribbella sp.]